MPLSKRTLEMVEKMSADAKAACKDAFGKIAKVKEGMSADEWTSFRKSFAFEGDEEDAAEEKKCLKKSADDAMAQAAAHKQAADEAVAALTAAKSVIAKSVGMLEGATPDLTGAVSALAPLAGVTPKSVLIAQLPAELKAQFEALQKSAADSANALVEMQKSVKAQQDATRKAELVAKAAQTYPKVPAKAEDIAALQMAVPESHLPTLTSLLDAVNGAMAKSALFQEQGTAATRAAGDPVPAGNGEAYAKVTAMAKEMVQKSDGKLTEAQARTQIWAANPDLYLQHEAECPVRAPKV